MCEYFFYHIFRSIVYSLYDIMSQVCCGKCMIYYSNKYFLSCACIMVVQVGICLEVECVEIYWQLFINEFVV